MSKNKIDTISDIRKTLLRNGYTPTPNVDKIIKLPDWQTVVPTEEMITKKWSRMHNSHATGVRIDWPLGAIDNDISLPVINDEVIDRWTEYLPDVFDGQPMCERGTTVSCKMAFFVRMAEKFGYLATREHEDAAGKTHKVEIWGGGTARQFGAFGAHSVAKGSTYRWPYESLLDVPLRELPEVAKEQCVELLRIAEEVMQAHGLKPVARLSPDSNDGDTAYDIVETMVFESADSVYSFAELKKLLEAVDHIRLTGTWHDPSSTNTDSPRCIARLGYDGGLLITDFGEDGRKHREASKAVPIDEEAVTAAFEALGEAVKEPPKEKEGAAAVAAKLCSQYCYYPASKTPVVSIAHPDESYPQANFITSMLRFSETRIGPRGGEQVINPAKLWLADRRCIVVSGLQMRPDQERPFFEEEGRLWLNTYRPPAHDADGGGDASMIWALIDQIAPLKDNRDWLTLHLAHKFQNPAIPGPAVIMLAQDQFGTGRGTFMKLLEKLFGRYVAQLPAHLFTGSSYQSQYTEWLADNVIVCIEEMIELKGQSKWSAKHDVYERLKELIEPRMKRRKIVRRGIKATDEMVSCSIYAFLNNLDDIPIHEQDRRCYVMPNSGPREEAFWIAVNAALDDPACVAAFAADLRAIDWNAASYSPYTPPPVTEIKLDMAEIAKPDLQLGLDRVLADLQVKDVEIFSMLHVLNGMRAVAHSDGLHYPERWEGVIGKLVGKRCKRVGVRNGKNWLPMIDGMRYATYAWTQAKADKWTNTEAQIIERALWKAGPLKQSYSGPFGGLGDQPKGSGDGGDDTDYT